MSAHYGGQAVATSLASRVIENAPCVRGERDDSSRATRARTWTGGEVAIATFVSAALIALAVAIS